MLEGEKLFVALNLAHQVDGAETKWLIENGYLTERYPVCYMTKLGEEFVEDFIKQYKMPLYQAMKKHDNRYYDAYKEIGLNDYVSYTVIAARLVHEGLFEEIKPMTFGVSDRS